MTSSVVHVVNDDALVRNGTARLLTAGGFEVRTYASALEFLGAIEPDATGCIVLDVICRTKAASNCRWRWRSTPSRCRSCS